MMKMLSAACLLGVVVLAGAATARKAPGVSAQTWPGDKACPQESYGSTINVCSTNKTFFFPAQVDSAGNKNVTVWAKSASSSANVCCRAFGIEEGSGGVWSSNYLCLSSFGNPAPITLSAAYTNGSLFVACDMAPNTRVISYSWNQ